MLNDRDPVGSIQKEKKPKRKDSIDDLLAEVDHIRVKVEKSRAKLTDKWRSRSRNLPKLVMMSEEELREIMETIEASKELTEKIKEVLTDG